MAAVPSSSPMRSLVFAGALALSLAVGIADYLTGVEISFSIFYLIPVSVAAWFLGRGPGLFLAAVCAATWFANDSMFGGRAYTHRLIPYWNASVRFGVFAIVTVILTRLADALHREQRAHRDLAFSYAALDDMRKQQLLIKDQLLSHVSQELGSPIEAVGESLEQLADGRSGELTPQQRECVGGVRRNVDRLKQMIQELLDATAADAGKLTIEPRALRIHELSAEVIRTLRTRASELGISLDDEIPADLPQVLADPTRVRQVLFNLIDNALKFTPTGGRVMARASVRDADPAHLCVAVSDTGRGIHPEAQVEIFHRLFHGEDGSAAGREGLGLGLKIARELVTRQGGRIWVESRPGRGSTFYFTLPLAPVGSAESSAV